MPLSTTDRGRLDMALNHLRQEANDTTNVAALYSSIPRIQDDKRKADAALAAGGAALASAQSGAMSVDAAIAALNAQIAIATAAKEDALATAHGGAPATAPVGDSVVVEPALPPSSTGATGKLLVAGGGLAAGALLGSLLAPKKPSRGAAIGALAGLALGALVARMTPSAQT